MNEPERPDLKVLHIWRAEVWSTWGILFVVAAAITGSIVFGAGEPAWILGFAALPLLGGAIAHVLLRLRWERWTFRLTPTTLEMNHGWLVRRQRIVARDRIQHVDFESGPIGRKFDLVHVVVHTAGANVGTIPGIPSERADRLRAELMSGIKSL